MPAYQVFPGLITGCRPVEPVCIEIVIKSPDIKGGGEVNLADFSGFGDAWDSRVGDAHYDPCCDFNFDGEVQFSDLGYFGSHWRHGCN